MKILDIFARKKNTFNRPYLIAEVGVNHECDIEVAKDLIKQAAAGGANAVKFQTYKADTIASKNSPAYWDTKLEKTKSQHQLFKKYDKFWKNEFEILKTFCEDHKIEFMSTPFDLESAKFLNDLVNVFKISSSDITNKPFIEYISSFKKPIILSTGASNMVEIKNAVDWISNFNTEVALLHCILNYPTDELNANLAMIKDLQLHFPKKIIGYSDHTLPFDMKVLEIAALLGCQIIEKHFTHDKSLPGNDHYHAMDKCDLETFIKIINRNSKILGDNFKQPLKSEDISRLNARRSLVISKDIKKNEVINFDHLTWKRPATGISPSEIDKVIGMKVKKDMFEDDILEWKFIE